MKGSPINRLYDELFSPEFHCKLLLYFRLPWYCRWKQIHGFKEKPGKGEKAGKESLRCSADLFFSSAIAIDHFKAFFTVRVFLQFLKSFARTFLTELQRFLVKYSVWVDYYKDILLIKWISQKWFIQREIMSGIKTDDGEHLTIQCFHKILLWNKFQAYCFYNEL